MAKTDAKTPPERSGLVISLVYGGFLVALSFFGLGRIWEGATTYFSNWARYASAVATTHHAFEVALARDAAMPRPNPAVPHTITIYPVLAQRRHEEGVVILQVLVRADGEVGDVHILKSSGSSQLDAAALIGVGYWYYIPAVRNHAAIDSTIKVQVVFRLGSGQS